MSDRKEKVAKKRKQRESVVDTDYGSTHSENGRVLDAPVITADALKPVVDKAHVMNTVDEPKPVPRRPARLPDVEQIKTPELATTSMSAPAPKGVYSTERVTPTQLMGKAEIKNPTGIVNPTIEAAKKASKVPTLSELLAEQRKTAIKDKTDAAKMQKYYALTDAFSALGKMGGAAIGGAIGGNILDNAPIVADYQPSRGYIDAFNRVQKANERLRSLDDKQFQLAYSKQQRDEERAYADKKTKEDRAYQAEQNRINREFQAEQARLTREWNKAVADADFARQAELKKEILDLQNRYAAADDKRSRDYLRLQYDLYNTKHPVMFSDGSVINLSTQQIEDMLENYKGQTVGGVKINEKNFGTVLRQNPQAFAEYFKMIGASPVGSKLKVAEQRATTTPVDTSFPQHISQIPLEYISSSKAVAKGTNSSEEVDLTKKWESSEI